MDIKNAILEFINKYYIYPIQAKTGYNIIQEITYGTLLFVMVYIFYRVCKFLKICIDRKFAEVTIFYVILITLMRALVDAGAIPRLYYTVTPGIVVLVGLYYMLSIIGSGALFKNKYHISAILMALIPISYLLLEFSNRVTHLEALLYVLVILFPMYFITIRILEKLKKIKNLNINNLDFPSRIDKYAIFSQLVDASATSIGIGIYGYWEQHPVPRFFMDLFSPYIIIPLKLIVVVLVLYIINKEIDNIELRNILKITIMSLGLAPGLRNLFRIVMGV